VPNISDVFVADFSIVYKHRPTKHCVCVSVSADKYILINTDHREKYDDFEIKSSDYKFLGSKNRFVSCLKLYKSDSIKLLRYVGNLSRDDMIKIVDKIQNSKVLDKIEKDSILPELRKWLLDLS
jgi:hypothetical protein